LRDFSETVFTHAEDLSHLKRRFCHVLIIEQQCATVFKSVALEAAEKDVYEPVVSYWAACRMQDLKPEHIVSESVEA
jgi:hypothetical protein